jgi:hypothetical protein
VRDSFVTCVTKTLLFKDILIFFNFLIFLSIFELSTVVEDVNMHRLIYNMYRVSAPVTSQMMSK